jgi:hypothetical protein
VLYVSFEDSREDTLAPRLRLAQIRLKEGKPDTARAILTDLVKTCPLGITPDDLHDQGKLMAEIEEKLFEKRWPSALR